MPLCEAAMVQVPDVKNVALLPVTEQTLPVEEAKLTIRPELAFADRVSGVPTVCVPGLAKVIVCCCRVAVTEKVWEMEMAAAKVALPACEAVIVQLPPAMNEAVVPATIQTLIVEEAKLTARPELAFAERLSGVPTVWLEMAGKVIVCDCCATVTL